MHPHSWKDKSQETENYSKSTKQFFPHDTPGETDLRRIYAQSEVLLEATSLAHGTFSTLVKIAKLQRDTCCTQSLNMLSLSIAHCQSNIQMLLGQTPAMDMVCCVLSLRGNMRNPRQLRYFVFMTVSYSVSFYWWIKVIYTLNYYWKWLFPKILFNDSGRLCCKYFFEEVYCVVPLINSQFFAHQFILSWNAFFHVFSWRSLPFFFHGVYYSFKNFKQSWLVCYNCFNLCLLWSNYQFWKKTFLA